MIVYERRDQAVLDCVSPYVYGIEQTSEEPCDVSLGACAWIGRFKPVMYNVDDPTFTWTTTLGLIWDSVDDEETVEIHVTSTLPETFDVTVVIDSISAGATTTSTYTQEFTTSVL